VHAVALHAGHRSVGVSAAVDLDGDHAAARDEQRQAELHQRQHLQVGGGAVRVGADGRRRRLLHQRQARAHAERADQQERGAPERGQQRGGARVRPQPPQLGAAAAARLVAAEAPAAVDAQRTGHHSHRTYKQNTSQSWVKKINQISIFTGLLHRVAP